MSTDKMSTDTMSTDRLHALSSEQGQSPWIDNLKRSYVADGSLATLVSRGVRGVTSNPTIFQKAIAGSDDYDEQFSALSKAGSTIEEAYWSMVIDDVSGACAVLRPVFEAVSSSIYHTRSSPSHEKCRRGISSRALSGSAPRTRWSRS